MLVSCTPETDFQSDFSILYLNANAKYVYTDLLLCGTLNNFSFLNLKHIEIYFHSTLNLILNNSFQ